MKNAQSSKTPGSTASWGEEVHSQLDAAMDINSPKQLHISQSLGFDAMILSPKASPRSNLPPTSKSRFPDLNGGGRLPTPIYGYFQQNMDTPMEGVSEQFQTQSTLEADLERSMCARRLPTPISEDEAMDVFDSPSKETENTADSQPRQPSRFAPPLSHSSSKRSKPMFSMGFRADCEMCRDRVPGHYNHIFRA